MAIATPTRIFRCCLPVEAMGASNLDDISCTTPAHRSRIYTLACWIELECIPKSWATARDASSSSLIFDGSSGVIKRRLHLQAQIPATARLYENPKYHPRQWVDCSGPTYK